MSLRFNWHGDEAAKRVKEERARRVERACIEVKNEVKVSISSPGPAPSAPGDPPHKQTGRLRASIAHEVDRESGTGRVGTNMPVGKWLELGTTKMAARPFLRPALDKMRDRIRAVLKGK